MYGSFVNGRSPPLRFGNPDDLNMACQNPSLTLQGTPQVNQVI